VRKCLRGSRRRIIFSQCNGDDMEIDIRQYISKELAATDLGAISRDDAIRRLVEAVFAHCGEKLDKSLSIDDVCRVLVKREEIQTTGLGGGAAFPHARIEGVKDLIVAVGISHEGIDWGSVDGKACNVICMMLSPINRPYLILQSQAFFARFFSESSNLEKLLRAKSAEEAVSLICSEGLVMSKSVTARDIMRPVEQKVCLDDSIEETARAMHRKRFDAIPVVDEKGVLVGEISCLDIFSFGLPDFFHQLRTISFMKHLDPFEKYFRYQKSLKVCDMYHEDVCRLSEDATLMEAVFEMTVKGRVKLYVVSKEQKLIGVIDRFSIINKILYL